MESKKINQLATELTPALSDLTIIGDPTTGISKKITLSQMASLFTGTVEEYANLASFPLVGVADTIYIALDTNVLYRWDTGLTSYVELSPNIINSLVFSDANGFDGTISLVGSVATLTITTALTTGSVGFIGASGALLQDNANFFWDDTNNRLGIGTNAPTTAIDTFGSGIITRVNGTSTNNAFIGFASAGTNKWSVGNVQSDHRFRIYSEANTSELVSVLQTGEFGIGIANPTTKLHIDGGANALIANLDANVSVAKSISFRSDNSNRINLEVSGTESGSNAGANFFIRRYSDAGALIDTPLTITRSTGAITLAGDLSGTTATFSGAFTLSSLTTGYITKVGTSGLITFSKLYENSFGGIQINNTDTNGAQYYTTRLGPRGNNDGVSSTWYIPSNAAPTIGWGTSATSTAFNISTLADDVTRLYISSGGNVGIGVTPSNWNTLTPLQIRNVSIAGYTSGTTHVFYASSNFYYGESGGGDKYITNGAASLYSQSLGSHNWYTAPVNSSGAGAALNFVQIMGLSGGGLTVRGLDTDFLVLTNTTDTNKQLLIGFNTSSNYARIQAIWQGNSYRTLYLNNEGGAVYAGGVRLDTLSDLRMKDSIQPIESALNKVLSITGKKFHLKDEEEGKLRYGFIAQELEGILDEFVIQTALTYKDEITGNEVKNLKSIENWASSWAALLVEAIKELNNKIDSK